MVLGLKDVTKYYGGYEVFKNINCQIEQGDRIGLVGRNGCGKTTLLNIICNNEPVDNGEVALLKGTSIGFLAQNSGLDSDNTILKEMKSVFSDLLAKEEKMKTLRKQMEQFEESSEDYRRVMNEYARISSYFEQMDGYNTDYKIKRILNGFAFESKDMDTPINTLSGGEKTRLAFCKLLLAEPDLLVLDEPTNHLDVNTLFWLEEYLKEYKGAILIVSHDRYFLDKVTEKIWDMERGELRAYKGNYSKYLRLKDEYIKRRTKEYEQQQNVIASYETYIEKNKVRASTAKSARSRENALEKMEIIEKPFVDTKRPRLVFDFDVKSGNDVLLVKNLSVGYDGEKLIDDINLDIKRGEFVAVMGKNGCGKSTLLKCLTGTENPMEGTYTFGKNVSVGYYDQEHLSLNKNNSVLSEVWNRFPRLTEQQVRNTLGSVLISNDDVNKKIGVLSGGERAKVLFAILKLTQANVLLLDEPTNHLDIVSKEVVEDALADYEGTVIAVSHDRFFVNKLFEKIVYINNKKATEYKGKYDDFIKNTAVDKEEEKTAEKETKQVAGGYKTREQKKLEAKQRQELSKVEAEINQVEQRMSAIEAELAEGGNDYEKLDRLCVELEECKDRHEKLYNEWSELMDALDG